MAVTARRGALGKRDANEGDIVRALRAFGVTVERISQAGVPDLLCSYRGRTVLMEVKQTKGTVTDAEQTFIDRWQGEVYIVRNADDALDVFLRPRYVIVGVGERDNDT